MLDEADTFLSDRKNAQRSWEISAVNEMLTQMESFEGIFIASTNFTQSIDSAAMLRFDIKIEFDSMTSMSFNQIQIMFEELLNKNNMVLDSNRPATSLKTGAFATILVNACLKMHHSLRAEVHQFKIYF